MEFGRENPQNPYEGFCMTVLGLKLSRRANAVSALHGEVSRAMWTGLVSGQSRRMLFRSVTSPTECMSPHGLRRKCSASTTVISDQDGITTAAIRESGKELKKSTTASCGKRTSALKSQLLEFVHARALEQEANCAEIHLAVRPPRAYPGCIDDRICPTVCNIQESESDSRRISKGLQPW